MVMRGRGRGVVALLRTWPAECWRELATHRAAGRRAGAPRRELWDDVQPYLGRTRAFWHWLMVAWKVS
jgi:hypothetical protein